MKPLPWVHSFPPQWVLVIRSVEEYVNGDDDIAVCVDLDNETWEENFMDNLAQEVAVTVEDEPDVDEEFDLSHPSPKIKTTERQYNH